ncbi:methyltransferase family protein [Luteibacter rhizovicinus]|uniref:Methyltransferase family protein n=1 Tax=Luteibacter rhizovicinus TaxID=242606 RepID=A0A4R3YQ88_9GAMM|nr:methyltransferase domain-containing protein [Luteibacter rhizovicinus]TCV94957.1 methyltransferase family protein [Luteibacter rhizovicinus]
MRTNAHYQQLELDRVIKLADQWRKKFGPKLRILDFGAGMGKYTSLFADQGFDVTGTDINERYISDLRSKGLKVAGVKEALDAKESQQVVFLSHIVEHINPDDLVELVPKLCDVLTDDGLLVIVTPVLGERFYHDFSHVRPYYPQSIRHAFGQIGAPISYGSSKQIELTDIYFFKDPFRTRMWRSFYVGTGIKRAAINLLNATFDLLWRLSGGRFGVTSSWLGVYRLSRQPK